MTAEPDVELRAARGGLRPPAGLKAGFILLVLVSAALLFSIEPMFARLVLPKLGGSPSVWAVALFFFEAALFLGYLYAHAINRLLPPGIGAGVHFLFLIAGFIALPISIPAWLGEPPLGDPSRWQLLVFTFGVGFPFMALAANAPLLQAWYARVFREPDGRASEPYFLYAASNFGSLASLLSYPFFVEPTFGLSLAIRGWSLIYVGFSLAMGILILVLYRFLSPREAPLEMASSLGERVRLGDVVFWLVLAFIPSALLTAFTNHVSTDVASAPLLWVVPLALYLLSFVLVFSPRPLLPPALVRFIHALAVIGALAYLAQTNHETWQLGAGFGTAAFFTSCLVDHRALYDLRPEPRRLTLFYAVMALGGGLGGLFSGLLAPRLFSEILEYPILLAATAVAWPRALEFFRGPNSRRVVTALYGAVLVVLWIWLPWWLFKWQVDLHGYGGVFALAAALAALALVAFPWPERRAMAVAALAAAVVFLPSSVRRGNAVRSYFGVYRVLGSEDSDFNILMHGTTLHGAERIRNAEGAYVADHTPGTYYHPKSPMALAIKTEQAALDELGRKGRYAIVGLGTGSLACYSRPGEDWRYYEIDPVMVTIARDPSKFDFITGCRPDITIVMGDARLTIAREPSHSLDLIIVDAFSSDAVPVHLLTAEAIKMYSDKLTDEGVLVLHISNRYLDLEGVLGATLPLVPDLTGVILNDDTNDGTYATASSTVGIFTKNDQHLARFDNLADPSDLDDEGMTPWTDDRTDVLAPLWSRIRGSLFGDK